MMYFEQEWCEELRITNLLGNDVLQFEQLCHMLVQLKVVMIKLRGSVPLYEGLKFFLNKNEN